MPIHMKKIYLSLALLFAVPLAACDVNVLLDDLSTTSTEDAQSNSETIASTEIFETDNTSPEVPKDLTQYNKQASKYRENVVELENETLTKKQRQLLRENSEHSAWFRYTMKDNGTPNTASALITYDSVYGHSSKVTERPSFASSLHLAGEYKDGLYNAEKQTWYSPSRAHSNNARIQSPSYKGYLYNKSHLIAWSLGGNMDLSNVILGTRSQNVGTNYTKQAGGMSYIETLIRQKVNADKQVKVYYEASPIYKAKEIVPRGVYVRAYSINDGGKTINKTIYTLNTQQGVSINYMNGTFR